MLYHLITLTNGDNKMIQLFSLSLINYINSRFEVGTEVYLSDSNDSQNAIAFSHEYGNIYWSVGVELESNKVVVNTVYLDTDYNKEFDETQKYDTLKQVVETIIYQINKLK